MNTDAPRSHSISINRWTLDMLRSGRCKYLIRRRYHRLIQRGDRVLILLKEPRQFITFTTIERVQTITLTPECAIVDGLRLGDRESDLLAFNAGGTDYPTLISQFSLPYEGILIQLSSKP